MSINSRLEEQAPSLRTGFLDAEQIALWFQPVYQLTNGFILHHEVLVRWRDRRNELHLPEKFLPALSRMGMMAWLDQQIIQMSIEYMQQDDELKLSVNLSEQSLNRPQVATFIQNALTAAKIEPKRLSIELGARAVASNLQAARCFIQAMNQLGCPVILDDFTSYELDHLQWQQVGDQLLQISMVKVDSQLAQLFITRSGEELSSYLVESRFCLGQVVVKFVEEAAMLNWARTKAFDGVQGCYLNAPDDSPRLAPFPALETSVVPATPGYQENFENTAHSTEQVIVQDAPTILPPVEPQIPAEPQVESPQAAAEIPLLIPEKMNRGSKAPTAQPHRFRLPVGRMLAATTFLSVGTAALAVGASSIYHRMNQIVIDGGVINGRVVRLRSQIDGTVTKFYAKPGVEVDQGQVLARVRRDPAEEQNLLALQGEIQTKNEQINAAIQTQTMLESQLQHLEEQADSTWNVEVNFANQAVTQQQAALDAAQSQARAARLDYDRYQELLDAGIVSQQQVDQLKAQWETAQATVEQAEAALQMAQSDLHVSESRTLMVRSPGLGNGFAEDATQLQQNIQAQVALVKTLTTERDNAQQRLAQAQSLYSNQQDLAVSAPFAGVVYRTERERNEQINRSEPLLTLLDCKDVWVEVMVSSYDAAQIDTNKPVKVELGHGLEPLTGEIDLIQPISSAQAAEDQSRSTQIQALQPSVPFQLAGVPVTRITIRIPPLSSQDQSQQFCGVGQLTNVTFTKQTPNYFW